ncbi:7097_t:CDS:10 [Funneliformis mosseae]|uniref:7097_t:CDS:1 n=1 Tax=Funneliformis mosseae TaxID=27381 RepID=A0A9N8V2Z1_FUNMO|nr:7097_t:CDS:10 [Funneliformis mosseae]
MNSQERASNSKISGLQFLKSDPKMRYLVEAIEKNRGASRMMDEEIVSTLTEIRSLGSKYADPNLVGRAELYEAIDSVLNALKSYSEYSSPFLKKVSSKEAPDYNKIIKRPMDLSQVSKNFKSGQYNSKKEFADDLYLIYDNCLLYNTDPANAAEIVAQVQQEIAAEEKPEMKEQPYLIQEQVSTETPQFPVVCSDEINEDECDRELQEMLKGWDAPLSQELWDPEIDNPDRDRLFDPEYWKEQEAKRPTLDQYPQLQFSNRGTAVMIEHNIETLKQTRLLHAKLLAAKHNLPLSHFGVNETAPTEKATNCRTQIDPNISPPLVMNREAGFACMQRVVLVINYYVYIFSLCVGGSSMAVNILTEVAQDYLLSLGKTMRAYRDDVFNKKSPEEIIKKTLYENGATSFKDLESYVRDDIERYGSKLKDIQRRLEIAYKDSLSQPDNTEADEDLPENDDVFITGNLGEGIELGDDFFGLKELGLGNLSVPTRLLLGTNKIKPAQKKTPDQNQRKSRYTPPPPFAPIDPDKQIGLLTEYFRNRLEDQSGKLIDDEFLPPKQRNQRPKVPPTGKIPPQPKRQPPKTAAQNAAALLEKKRKRERDAAIAEEKEKAKRIRIEERLKAQQEREEQKRIKQEQREAKKKAEAEEKRLKKLQAEAEKKAEREKRAAEAAAQRAEAKKVAEKKESKKKKPTTTKVNRTPTATSTQQVRGGSSSSTMAGSSSAGSKKILDQIDDSDSEDVPLAVRKKTRTKEAASSNARGGNGRGNSRPPNIN